MTAPVEAPALPKGWFFRVTRGHTYRYRVSLRKKLFGRFITYEFDYWFANNGAEISERMDVLRRHLNCYGDYPPKKNVGGIG